MSLMFLSVLSKHCLLHTYTFVELDLRNGICQALVYAVVSFENIFS